MAKEDPYKLHFEASANLQRLIGRELIPNEEMSIIELVKNAYDAGAHHVFITIQPQTDKEAGYLEIKDDGQGMNLDDLKRVFMFAGYSERPDQGSSSTRIPTGEKGVGRFAADKLGKKLSVFTKLPKKKDGIQLDIDWEAFKNKKRKFSDITASYRVGPIPSFVQEESGTRLLITHLRRPWARPLLESVRRKLSELIDPLFKPKDFQIELQIQGSLKLSGPIEPVKPSTTDIEVKFKILRDGTTKRKLSYHLDKMADEDETLSPTPYSQALVGLCGHFFYSIKRPTKEITRGLSAGVRLYRDGFHVEPFASPSSDWLGISEKRAKRAGHAHIVPSRLFGFVEISRKEHPDLRDTTSRQALIDTDAARSLVTFLRDQLIFLEDKIRKKITEPRWKESRQRQAVELEQSRLQTLGIMSFGLAHELRQPLQSIRSEAGNIKTRLNQLDIKDTEIEQAQINIDEDIERIDKRINLISAISKGNIKDVSQFDLADLIRELCQPYQTQYASKGIEILVKVPDHQETIFNKFAVTQVLLNLLQNSVEAIEQVKDGRKGEITVSVSKIDDVHSIEVIDNGVGIPDDIKPKIFKRFASKKTGGMGVGLYLCHSTIRALSGEILFSSRVNVGTTFSVKFSDRKV